MNRRYFIILLVAGTLNSSLMAQILDKNQYSKITVPRSMSYQVAVDSIYIDTLIMEDDSKFVFSRSTVLIIEAATIGDRCIWDASGKDAVGTGNDGQPGNSISSVMIIRSLGSLAINTQGGRGGHGAAGRPGSAGLDGAQFADGGDGGIGGDGGNGGNGGDIKFHYRSDKLVSPSGDQSDYSVVFNNKGGKRGEGGVGGKGGRAGNPKSETDYSTGKIISVGNRGQPGRSGQSGNPGIDGVDGRLIFKRFD